MGIFFQGETAEIIKRDGHFIFSCRFLKHSATFPQQLLSELFTAFCLVDVTSLNPQPSSQIQ